MQYGYRHTAGVVLVLLLFFAGCTVSLAQVSSTGDLVNPTTTTSGSTWTNGVYQSSLTCWQGGDPGYCGPNAIVRPGNEINFSYGTTDLYQQVAIAQALPNSGTGLVVRGWNFGYTAKVGNGWDNGAYDYLQSYVQFRDAGGTIKESWSSIHTTTHDWTTYNYSGTFTERYTTQNLTTARFGFIGRDNNYWAGPYGPEVNNVSFSLQYAPDPCVNSQLSSPQCPRFMETLSQMSAIPGIASTPAIPALPSPSDTSEQSGLAAAASIVAASSSSSSQSSNGSSAVNANAQLFALSLIRNNQQRETRLGSSASAAAMAEAEAAAEAAQRDAESRAEASQTAAQAAAETATAQPVSSGQVAATTTMPAFTVSVPPAPIIQSVNNESATQQSMDVTVVIQAQPVNNTVTSIDIEQPQPPSVVTAAVRMTAPNGIRSQDIQEQASESAPVIASPVIVSPVIESTVVDVGSIVPPTAAATVQQTNVTPAAMYTPPASAEVGIVNTIPAVEIAVPVIQVAAPVSTPVETVQSDNPATSPTNFTTNRTNPITEIVEQRQIAMSTTTPAFAVPVVNTRVQDNELAGDVRIDGIARVPAGFDVYASLTLRDAAFYAPREIYRGQRNVDNRRALSSLAQEGRHQEMVDQQYRR